MHVHYGASNLSRTMKCPSAVSLAFAVCSVNMFFLINERPRLPPGRRKERQRIPSSSGVISCGRPCKTSPGGLGSTSYEIIRGKRAAILILEVVTEARSVGGLMGGAVHCCPTASRGNASGSCQVLIIMCSGLEVRGKCCPLAGAMAYLGLAAKAGETQLPRSRKRADKLGRLDSQHGGGLIENQTGVSGRVC